MDNLTSPPGDCGRHAQDKGDIVQPFEIVDRLVPHCQRICGHTIKSVDYHVLQGEATTDQIDDPNFYLGGEISLGFPGTDSLFVSWQRFTGYPDFTYCVALGKTTLFLPGHLQTLSADQTSIWSSHIGKTVKTISLYGLEEVPFVLSLETTAGTVLLGSASRTTFGDGDDVFVTTDGRNIGSMSIVWKRHDTE